MKPSTVFDFEKPIVELENKLEEMKRIAQENKVEMGEAAVELEKKILNLKKNIYGNLNRWQREQISSIFFLGPSKPSFVSRATFPALTISSRAVGSPLLS